MKLTNKLHRTGNVAEVKDEKSRAFDIAYAEENAYLIKIVHNIESINQDFAETIRKCASVVGAEPIVISERGKEILKEDVVYTRHGIPVMREKTFVKIARGDSVSVADKGGTKVPLKDLRPAMKRVGMSRATLAGLLKVSSEMIRKYERGSAPSGDVAKRLVEIFGNDILEKHTYECLPLKRAFIGKAPFDIAINKQKTLLISFKTSPTRVKNLKGVAEVLGAEPVVADKLEDIDF